MAKLITRLNFHYIYRTMYISAVVQINMAKHFFFFFQKEDYYCIKKSAGISKEYIIEVWWNILHPHRQTSNMSSMFMVCLEVQRWKRVKGSRVVGRRVEENNYPLPCLDVFKISKGEGSNYSFLLFGCFKNQEGE